MCNKKEKKKIHLEADVLKNKIRNGGLLAERDLLVWILPENVLYHYDSFLDHIIHLGLNKIQ